MLKKIGPAIIIILTSLGVGDIISSMKSGAEYGLSLIWILTLIPLLRVFLLRKVSIISANLKNSKSILESFHLIHPFFLHFIFISILVTTVFLNTYMLKGLTELSFVFIKVNKISLSFFWSLLVILLLLKSKIKKIEILFKIFLVCLVLTTCVFSFSQFPQDNNTLRELFSFSFLNDKNKFLFAIATLAGAIGGSIMNLAYPYIISSKKNPEEYRNKFEKFDLIISFIGMAFINSLFWITGKNLFSSNSNFELGNIIQTIQSQGNEYLFVIFVSGCLSAVLSSFIGICYLIPKLIEDCFRIYKINNDKYIKYLNIMVLYLIPIIVLNLSSKLFIAITLVGSIVQAIIALPINTAIFKLSLSEKYVHPSGKLRRMEIIFFLILILFSVFAAVSGINSLIRN